MGVFTLRDPGGGSALRDSDADALREGWNDAFFVEALADTVHFQAGADVLTDEAGDPLVDENGAPLLVTDGAGDRQGMAAGLAEVVVFADGSGGGTNYTVSGASTVTFTTVLVDSFGGGTHTYTHAGNDTLTLSTATGDTFNLITIPLLAPSVMPWGTSQQWNAWVELLVDGQVIASSADGDFALLGGRVTEDLTRAVTADAQLDLGLSSSPSARNPLLPTRLGSLLDPNNHTHVRVFAGYEGSEVQLGLFDLATAPVSVDQAGAQVSITAMSLERTLQRAGFWTVEAFGAGLTNGQVVVRMVTDVVGAVPMVIESNPAVMPEFSWKPGDDRLAKIREVAEAAAMEFRFDRLGRMELRNAPTAASWQATPQWVLSDGLEAPIATLLSAEREFSDEDSYNGVVVEATGRSTGDNTPPIFYTQWITNPASPLYFNPNAPSGARRGPRPKLIRNEWVFTVEQAAALAAHAIAFWMSVADSVTVTAPANPAIRMGEHAQLRCRVLGVDDVYRVFRVVHDLSGGPLEATLNRYQQVT